ncbi:hypothetical protein PA7_22970 [Pseudonocardia asaccharolytica DSM 44247 = NBRC 16224]|uniref:Uncharacterized protein n=1 Tax=Pseudonocardia asaccharolytica DSM 44247 = NBRC 16224 TaxID=1123024 RepID=A0A511D0Z3_9PSEU|nr:hypothetical protein PA7_22970 [Pseudonocardia asaccharolytica DSM 44247 = NBRC 16224]
MIESRSTVSGPVGSAGPAPAAPSRARSSRETASSSRTFDHLNARSQHPIVEDARTWSNSPAPAPPRSASTAAGNNPAHDTRFISSNLTDTRASS